MARRQWRHQAVIPLTHFSIKLTVWMLHSQHEPIQVFLNISYFQEMPRWVQMQTDKYRLWDIS